MAELFQRMREPKLVQWALAYVAAAFALLQGVDIVAQRFGWPESVERLLIIVLAVGFFVSHRRKAEDDRRARRQSLREEGLTMSLIDELKRRKVFKVGSAYLVVAWLAVQAVSIGFPAFDAPLWALRVFILMAMLGFPIALVFAWMSDMTPGGVKAEGSSTRATIGVYVAAAPGPLRSPVFA